MPPACHSHPRAAPGAAQEDSDSQMASSNPLPGGDVLSGNMLLKIEMQSSKSRASFFPFSVTARGSEPASTDLAAHSVPLRWEDQEQDRRLCCCLGCLAALITARLPSLPASPGPRPSLFLSRDCPAATEPVSLRRDTPLVPMQFGRRVLGWGSVPPDQALEVGHELHC